MSFFLLYTLGSISALWKAVALSDRENGGLFYGGSLICYATNKDITVDIWEVNFLPDPLVHNSLNMIVLSQNFMVAWKYAECMTVTEYVV